MIEPFGFMENGLISFFRLFARISKNFAIFGIQTAEYYRPSQKLFADSSRAAEIRKISYRDAAPTPSGMSVSIMDGRLALTMVGDWAVQYRRVYGYIGEIRLLPACGAKMNYLGYSFFGWS